MLSIHSLTSAPAWSQAGHCQRGLCLTCTTWACGITFSALHMAGAICQWEGHYHKMLWETQCCLVRGEGEGTLPSMTQYLQDSLQGRDMGPKLRANTFLVLDLTKTIIISVFLLMLEAGNVRAKRVASLKQANTASWAAFCEVNLLQAPFYFPPLLSPFGEIRQTRLQCMAACDTSHMVETL